MNKIFLFLFFCSFFIKQIAAQVIIPDNSSVSGTWTLSNSPYIIEGRAIIPEGLSLNIEPGVEVRLKSSAAPLTSWFDYSAGNVGVIRVQGEIRALGTVSNPIIFTRDNSTGNWGTILVDETASTNSIFSNCIIEYAKESRNVSGISSVVSFDAGVSVYKTKITIDNTIFRNNNINGLYIVQVNDEFTISNNTIHSNGANGLVIENSIVNAINNTIYSNSEITSGFVAAIRSSGSTTFLVGNLIYNNDDFAIYTTSGGSNTIVNNTIYSNFQGLRVENGANTFVYNSIIQNNTLNFATSSPGGAIIEAYNCLSDSPTLPITVADMGGNILGSNAVFTDISSSNFSLQHNSPCINNGNSIVSGLNLPNFDIIGNPRIVNEIIDMGAFEKQSTFSSIIVSACDNYVSPSGNYSWSSSGIYQDTISNAAGLDSVMTINLTINFSSSSFLSISSCDSYTAPDGQVYTTSGLKTAIIPNSMECDSVISINLTIKSSTSS
jgi:parallel beta-helix repeat protein